MEMTTTAEISNGTNADRDHVLRLAWDALRNGIRECRMPDAPPAWYAEMLRCNAYHEAGHVAVSAFFDSVEPIVLDVTIIPEGENAGVVNTSGRYRLVCAAPSVAAGPFEWGEELRLMVDAIAGDAARAKAGGERLDFWAWRENDGNQELEGLIGTQPIEWRRDMSDEEKVWSCAERMANSVWSPYRIARRAHSLALELLDIPEVWACVCAVAEQLLMKGELGHHELRTLCAPARGLVGRLPKWRRRFTAFVRTNQFARAMPEHLRSNAGLILARRKANAA